MPVPEPVPEPEPRRRVRVWLYPAAVTIATAASVSFAEAPFVLSDLDVTGEIQAVRLVDVDGDARNDVLVVVQTERTEERTRTTERGGDYVMEVVSVVVREREARLYRQDAAGRFVGAPQRIPIDPDAHGLDAADVDGDGRAELLLLMEDRIDALSIGGDRAARRQLVSCRSLYGDTVGLRGDLELAQDLDGDGRPELLVPAGEGLLVYWNGEEGIAPEPTTLARPRLSRRATGGSLAYGEALPVVADATGDGLVDVTYLLPWGAVESWPQKRRGTFVANPVRGAFPLKTETFERSLVAATDVTGDGILDVVSWREPKAKSGDGEEDEERPRGAVSLEVFRGGADLSLPAVPTLSFDLGKPAKGESLSYCQVADLDGDGRDELLPVFMRVGTFQVLKALVSKSITIALRIPVVVQDGEGRLRQATSVEDEMKVSLKRLSASFLLSFDADVDGDGTKDLVRPGGKGLRISRGRPGGSFEGKASFEVPLADAEGLVGGLLVEDLDGDGRDDIVVVGESWKKDRLSLRVAISALPRGAGR